MKSVAELLKVQQRILSSVTQNPNNATAEFITLWKTLTTEEKDTLRPLSLQHQTNCSFSLCEKGLYNLKGILRMRPHWEKL